MIIYRSLITPDGTHLVSHFRGDFTSHKDKNGKFYFLEGGLNYPRYSQNGDERFLEFGENEVSFTLLRSHFEILNFNNKYEKLKDISDKFLQVTIDNIVENLKSYKIQSWQLPIFLEEKLYRAENLISIL
jgi:hypothetical protein